MLAEQVMLQKVSCALTLGLYQWLVALKNYYYVHK